MKLVKCIPEIKCFTVFLKNRNIISKIKRSKVSDYAALSYQTLKGLNAYKIEANNATKALTRIIYRFL